MEEINNNQEQIQETRINAFAKKNNITAKKLIKATTLLMGLILIVFMTIANVLIDPSNLDFFKWLTSSLILVGIMVFGLLIGESIGLDKQQEKINSLFQRALRNYKEQREIIEPISLYFAQFFGWFKEKELKRKKIDFLIENEFEGVWAKSIITFIAQADLTSDKLILKGEPNECLIYVKTLENGNVVKIKRVNQEQANIIRNALRLTLDAPSYAYYLSAYDNVMSGGMLERSKKLQRKLKADRALNRTLKIVSSLFISLIWGMATVKDFADGAQKVQAWMDLISRLTALITSFSAGYAGAVLTVKTQSEVIENKTSVLKMFKKSIELNEFKPETYEEQIERESIKLEQKQQSKPLEPRKTKKRINTPKQTKSV